MKTISKTLLSIFTLSFLALLTTQSFAFDCKKARNTAEKTICKHSSLRALDERMSRSYVKAMRSITAKGQKNLRASQHRWLISRGQCGKNTSCLKTHYKDWLVGYANFMKKLSSSNSVKKSKTQKKRKSKKTKTAALKSNKRKQKSRKSRKKKTTKTNKKMTSKKPATKSEAIEIQKVSAPKVISDN